jgi:hypothetical protein
VTDAARKELEASASLGETSLWIEALAVGLAVGLAVALPPSGERQFPHPQPVTQS